MDETAPGFYGTSQEPFNEDTAPPLSADGEGVANMDGVELVGDNLVSQPRKVCMFVCMAACSLI